ncbi:MAG: hypothetical protein AAFP84_01405 [Actinomycetota bacterium]
MSLSTTLASALGVYHGTGDGPESGSFVSRIEVTALPNGGVCLDYEATSREQGVQHRERSLLAPGPDGRDRLYIAHSEAPFVTEMIAVEAGSSRFAQPQPFGPFAMEVVVEVPEPGRITYAWRWAAAGATPTEQSRADVRLTA